MFYDAGFVCGFNMYHRYSNAVPGYGSAVLNRMWKTVRNMDARSPVSMLCNKESPAVITSKADAEMIVRAAVRVVFVAYCLNAHIKCRPVHDEATEGGRV
jgi:hypothetical protein